MDRPELVKLVEHIMTTSGCMVDVDGLIERFERAVGNPGASELIFNPPSGKRMTADQIVDLALSPSSQGESESESESPPSA